ncbi:glucan endo-1,3-beta-glucosidase [Quercus suber]
MAYFFEMNNKFLILATFMLLGLFMSSLEKIGAQPIGVCYGQIGDNLPPEQEVINLFRTNGIGKMRIYGPNPAILEALRGSNIELILDVTNDKLQALSDAATANDWVRQNVLNYPDVTYRYIAVGNEIKPNDGRAQYVVPAMQNIHNAIVSANLQDQIKVSTSIDMSLLGNAYPPSAGSFSDSASSYMASVISFLANNGAPLLANVYPYFSYIGNSQSISLDYALLRSPGVVVQDGEYGYQNLFDAILDALYSALEKSGGSNVKVVVSESGWPSEGHAAATIDNAATYYQNLINHVNSGTPKRPGQAIQTHLFAMFDENNKGPEETERHFGLFHPDKQPKYQIRFN